MSFAGTMLLVFLALAITAAGTALYLRHAHMERLRNLSGFQLFIHSMSEQAGVYQLEYNLTNDTPVDSATLRITLRNRDGFHRTPRMAPCTATIGDFLSLAFVAKHIRPGEMLCFYVSSFAQPHLDTKERDADGYHIIGRSLPSGWRMVHITLSRDLGELPISIGTPVSPEAHDVDPEAETQEISVAMANP